MIRDILGRATTRELLKYNVEAHHPIDFKQAYRLLGILRNIIIKQGDLAQTPESKLSDLLIRTLRSIALIYTIPMMPMDSSLRQ